VVASEIVRIGDLVDGAGVYADIAIFRAPDLGRTGTVAAAQVMETLRRHGLGNVDAGEVREISVTRLSRAIDAEEIQQRIADALAGRRGLGEARNLTITFDREIHSLQIDPSAGELRIAHASYEPRSARFDVTFELAGGASGRRSRMRYTGTIVEMVEVAVLMRPAGRGDVLRAGDIVVERRPKATVVAGALATPQQIAGLAARRSLPSGQPLRAADLMKPELVRQHELVTVTYDAPGVSLSMRGKALESGAEGDIVSVSNVQTKRVMQGTVTGPNHVSITVAKPRFAAASRETASAAATAAPSQRVE
jgi:flagella basal body P-ring formation protein FlgA